MLQIFLNAFFGLKLSRNIEEAKLCQFFFLGGGLSNDRKQNVCTGIYSNMYKHCQWETRSIWNTTMVHICMYVGCTLN